jgi:hypothetical protein
MRNIHRSFRTQSIPRDPQYSNSNVVTFALPVAQVLELRLLSDFLEANFLLAI